MQFKDLGTIAGEITVFGGVYSNMQALEALLGTARGTLICTGDLVAYCGAPAEVVARMQRTPVHVIAGNCEKQLAAGALDCGCGFEAGTVCDALSARWYAHANAQVGESARKWMAGLPDMLRFEHGGRTYAVLHGGASDVARFVWSVSAAKVFTEELNLLNEVMGHVDIVLAGHSGIAFERSINGARWVNAGAIGMPPHDGGQTTEFLRISPVGDLRFERLAYDVAGAVQDMTRAGLTQGYDRALQTGIWPSEDVLPQQLRRSSQSASSASG